jgi:hypothetical protein
MSVVDWVLRAYEHDRRIPLGAVLVLGPFMPPAMQRQFRERAKVLPRLAVVTFDAHVERLMERADGVVAMAGTTRSAKSCRWTSAPSSFRGPSRARSSCCVRCAPPKWGWCARSTPRGIQDPRVMAAALRGLADQPLPSSRGAQRMLGGLDVITDLVAMRVGNAAPAKAKAAAT